MNQYEVIYGHTDMNPDYKGVSHKWARDEKAVKDLFKKKPFIKIISIREVPPSK
jgi:hypothetical protein